MTTESTRNIEEAYNIKVEKVIQCRDGYIVVLYDSTRYLLKPVKEPLERIYYTYTAEEHLKDNGFDKICFYHKSVYNLPFARINNTFYTLTPFYQGKEMSFDNSCELGCAAQMLAEMHTASKGFTKNKAASQMVPGFCLIESIRNDDNRLPDITVERVMPWIRCTLGQTIGLYTKHLEELKRFKKHAIRNRGIFDLAYLEIADYYIDLATQVVSDLSQPKYTDMVESAKATGYICHKDYTAHNLVAGPESGFIQNFDLCGIELPVYDVSNFLRRKLRKSNWAVQDATFILEKYSAHRPLSYDDLQMLRLLIMYPQKLWRIINKYYNSKKSWCEKGCLEKLREIADEREPFEQILTIFA